MDVADAGKTVDYWLDWHLQNWADWMHQKDLPDGYPHNSCCGIVQNFTTVDLDNDYTYDHLDTDLAHRTNAVIDSLPPAQRAAVYRKYGVTAAFRFERDNYADLLVLARAAILIGLRRRGVWLGQ